jgi:hypothetical protein
MELDDRRIAYETLTLGGLVQRHARYRGDDVAVVAPDGAAEARLSWRAFGAPLHRTAHAPACTGVPPGDRCCQALAPAGSSQVSDRGLASDPVPPCRTSTPRSSSSTSA